MGIYSEISKLLAEENGTVYPYCKKCNFGEAITGTKIERYRGEKEFYRQHNHKISFIMRIKKMLGGGIK